MYDLLIPALKTAIGAVWPEVKPNGIWHIFQLARIPWQDEGGANKTPLCILDFDLKGSGEWGADNRMDAGPLAVYYVVDDSVTPDQLLAKLEALRTAIWDTGLSYGQVMEFPDITFNLGLPLNHYFINSQRPFYAGAVVMELIAGTTP